jgi:hypothetical protein
MSLLGISIVMKVLSLAQKLDQIYFKRHLNYGSARGPDNTVYGTAIPGHLCPNVFVYHFPLQASTLTNGKTIILVLLQMVPSSLCTSKTIYHLWCCCWWGWSILVWYPFYRMHLQCFAGCI